MTEQEALKWWEHHQDDTIKTRHGWDLETRLTIKELYEVFWHVGRREHTIDRDGRLEVQK